MGGVSMERSDIAALPSTPPSPFITSPVTPHPSPLTPHPSPLTQVDAIKTDLVSRTEGERGALYVAEMRGGVKSTKMDHLVCFLPGMLALGYWHGANDADELHMAEELLDTCVGFYKHTPTGLVGNMISTVTRSSFARPDPLTRATRSLARPQSCRSSTWQNGESTGSSTCPTSTHTTSSARRRSRACF